jgi:CO/xanthine dehydrogenase Mo-binding subunit
MSSASLQRNPQLDTWLSIDDDGRITIYPGKVELGQAIHTALALIVAEELDVDVQRIRIAPVDSIRSADEVYTSGSQSMEDSGSALRQAAAHARHILLQQAAQQLGVGIDQLEVDDGEIRAPAGNRWTDYWQLMAGKRFDCAIDSDVAVKPAAQYRQIGKANRNIPPRPLTAIVSGEPYFLHDLDLPDMLHGRVVRPPHYHAQLESLDETSVLALPGVLKVVRDGNFLGVVAEQEYQALKAAARLAQLAGWRHERELDTRDIYQQLKNNRRESRPVVDGIPRDAEIAATDVPATAAKTLRAAYRRPYHMHAALGPCAAAAQFDGNDLTVWTHAQGVYPTRAGLAEALNMDEGNIRVIHVPGAGCYGHNAADDAALDAALLARAVAPRPLLLSWSREDEHAWEPYGPAMLMELRASLDEQGRIIDWRHESYSDTHIKRLRERVAGKSALLAAWHLAEPLEPPDPGPNMTYNGGVHRNATPLYRFPRQQIIKHRVYDLPLRVSALRSLGAYANIFAIESFMDELAHAAGVDALAFRMNHLADERARAVLERAAAAADWGKRQKTGGYGRGLAVSRYKNNKCYAAVVIDLQVDEYGRIRLERAVIAADAGQIVDAGGLRNQLEGGLIQAASWTLKEQVTYDRRGITSRDWDSYPILRFEDIPPIETVLIDRPDQPYLGSGEGTMGPTPAAIANAVFDAVGLRLRQVPFTPEQLRRAAAD